MYCRWFTEPDPAYGQLVTRLYGAATGAALYATYCAQLSRDAATAGGGRPLWGHRLDWQGLVLCQHDEVVAHAVVQVVKDRPLVYVGYVEAVDTQEVAARLVEAVRARVRSEQPGRSIYLPVNLSIWHSYRFKTWGDEPLPFETPCQPYYGRLFGDLFADKEQYSSYRMPVPRPRVLASAGWRFRIRQLSLSNLMSDLRALYELSGTIFESYHSSPSLEEFAAIYSNMLGTAYYQRAAAGPHIDPELALIAEQDGRPLGLIFAVAEGPTVYVKTFGVLPEVRGWGVARHLYDALCLTAGQMGCTTLYGLMIRDDRPIRLLLPSEAVRVASYTLFKDCPS